jgi:hypothetical protein
VEIPNDILPIWNKIAGNAGINGSIGNGKAYIAIYLNWKQGAVLEN